jgi:hypothetical protein
VPEEYQHLRLFRSVPVNPRRSRAGWLRLEPPKDTKAHGKYLEEQLIKAEEKAKLTEPGFDSRLLLKIQAVGIKPEDLESIEGLSMVSQEGKDIVVYFASEKALAEFKDRLEKLKVGIIPTRKELFYAIKGFDNWSPDDRIGQALKKDGIPEKEPFTLDVELWPLEKGPERDLMLDNFTGWCKGQDIELIDLVNQETVIIYRIKSTKESLKKLLEHRDVRQVDLPPLFQLNVGMVQIPLQELPEISVPTEGVPGIVVLDSGVATGHPLLSKAIGDAQSFIPGKGAEDEAGHGTMVAGLALYGDLIKSIEKKAFIPQLFIFSGRITDENNENITGLLENYLANAVDYFVQNYGCRIFNLSFGDSRHPYVSGHVRGLAAVLDSLVREYRVLFVVSAGNFSGTETIPADWRGQFPDYLFSEDARLIDPAPSINSLTVGSLARFEQSRMGQRYPQDPAYQPVARADQPSPFSRSGPGPLGCIKPDVVEYGGNCSIDLRTEPGRLNPKTDYLGEISTYHKYIPGNLFSIDRGTSFAAPKIAHLAGLLLKEYPDASTDLLRALIVAHARHPEATKELFNNDEEKIYFTVGYGKPNQDEAVFSSERRVTLVSEDEMIGEQHHFYEVPLPEDFFKPPARRNRRITVALAHTPMVRRTRFNYKASTISFRIVKARDLDTVDRIFRKTSKEEREALLPEINNFRPTSNLRSKGTVQASTAYFKQIDKRWGDNKIFIVVTRSLEDWAKDIYEREPYALVVVIEDQSSLQVRYYTQIQEMIRLRIRA